MSNDQVPDHIAPEYREQYAQRMAEAKKNTKVEPLIVYDDAKLNFESAQAAEGVNFLAIQIFHAVAEMRGQIDQIAVPPDMNRHDLKLQAEQLFLRSLAETAAKGGLLALVNERAQNEGDLFKEGVDWSIGEAYERLKAQEKLSEKLRSQAK